MTGTSPSDPTAEFITPQRSLEEQRALCKHYSVNSVGSVVTQK